ncbi:hypothetical protein FGO68_gene15935 [Halteria grandinella]|uniref:Uncharacterized protein n=1 Tax=Halteria grandinella TaxID=5974 RepID=A0A8J8NZA1_HALGN|nr:hypothetical protein FGO68_gene15935 [Halteria grandinella]
MKNQKVKKLQLQKLKISIKNRSAILLIQDIIQKSKDTLNSLECSSEVDLSSLENSEQLKQLKIGGDIGRDNFEVIKTFADLEELSINNGKIIGLFNNSHSLKKLEFTGSNLNDIQSLPESVVTVFLTEQPTFKSIKAFLAKNKFVSEIYIEEINDWDAALLFQQFKHVKFNFNTISHISTFKECYDYIHPEFKQAAIQVSNLNNVLQALLNQGLAQRKLFNPYLKAFGMLLQQMLPYIDKSIFYEFQNCIIYEKQDALCQRAH